jgi:hypothetical protein
LENPQPISHSPRLPANPSGSRSKKRAIQQGTRETKTHQNKILSQKKQQQQQSLKQKEIEEEWI